MRSPSRTGPHCATPPSEPESVLAVRKRLASDQDGLGIVEVLVAAVLLVVASLATVGVMIASARSNYRAEQSQVAIDRAQAEMEAVRALDYGDIALTAPPQTGVAGPEPRLSSSCAAQGVSADGCFALNANGTNSAPLVVEGGALEDGGSVMGAAVDSGPVPFSSGDVSGQVYRYVVWQNDNGCSEAQCPGGQDRKRVVVVVTINETASGGERAYREVQSDFIDPELGRDTEPLPSPAQEVDTQQFWLTDTPCDRSDRPDPVAGVPYRSDHPLHNTLGACSAGERTGATVPGAPDLLLPSVPPEDPLYGPAAQPEYDFATDVEPAAGAGADKGIQVRRSTTSGCQYTPSGASAHEWTHRWVSTPMPAGETFVMEGGATLELWTKTLSEAVASGEICVFLFVRDSGGGAPVDTPITDAMNPGVPYFTASMSSWPNTAWGELSVDVEVEPPAGETVVRVLPGQRLGLAIAVRKDGTSADSLQFMYEHPGFQSRLEVETTTPLS